MQMDIKLLEAFRAVMDNHSVTGAAKVLGLTQPAVSAQIARLEAQVGFELFERVGGRLKATARGRRFCDEVRTVLDSIDTLASTARNIRSGETETLTVASHPGASISLMPGVIAKLLERRPEARLRLINRTSEEVGRIFEAGGADIAIAEWPIHVQGVDLRRFDVPCVAILPQAHPLTAQEVITAEDLAGEPFVAMAETRLIGHRLRSVFSDAGIRLAPVADSEYFSTICGLVAAGCGVAVVDRLSALSFRPMGLAIRRFEPALRYEIGLFRRKTALLSPIAEDLITLIDAAIRSASDESEAPEMETVE